MSSTTELAAVFERLARPRILVVGDLILDRYTHGQADRVGQEAPVLVLLAQSREERLGGAANVAHLLRGLEAEVAAVGVVGDDEAGQVVRRLLAAAGIDCAAVLVDASRPTTTKERFVGCAGSCHPSQVLRVDRETRDPVPAELERRLIGTLVGEVAHYDAVLISDYEKGVCTDRLLKAVIGAARKAGVPTIVDPGRSGRFARYAGATVIKPNRLETQAATDIAVRTTADAAGAGWRLCAEYDFDLALVTLDRDGMVLVGRDGSSEACGTHARKVFDITGAGDMVLAMFGLAFAAGVSTPDAVRLANVAAGLEVERPGVSVVYRQEIRAELATGRGLAQAKIVARQDVAELGARLRATGARTVFTNGCFDLLHVGHVSYLAEAAALGDVLIVALNSDASVRRLKGPQRPVIGESDRAAMLASLACVSHVIVFDEDTPHALLEELRPAVLVKGGTYAPHEVVGREVVERYGGAVRVVGMVDGISTTRILESLAEDRRHSDPAAPLSALRRAG